VAGESDTAENAPPFKLRSNTFALLVDARTRARQRAREPLKAAA